MFLSISVYMLHETSQCFMTHSRDFCYVSKERIEVSKCGICPPTPPPNPDFAWVSEWVSEWVSAKLVLRNGPDKNEGNNGNEHVGMQKRC